MTVSLKQQLAARPDARQREVSLHAIGGEPLTVTIRRVTVGERDQLIKDYQLGATNGTDRGIEASIAIVRLALVSPDGEPPITEEEVRAMPAAIVDEVAQAILDFNGWTKAGKAALDDQFRSAAGPAV